jgi:hypothetical protein
MCPNAGTHKTICPGIEGSPHHGDSKCDFAARFFDSKRTVVFVGLCADGVYASLRESVSGGMHRVKSPSLPPRGSFDEAQEDLNKYAESKGWWPA